MTPLPAHLPSRVNVDEEGVPAVLLVRSSGKVTAAVVAVEFEMGVGVSEFMAAGQAERKARRACAVEASLLVCRLSLLTPVQVMTLSGDVPASELEGFPGVIVGGNPRGSHRKVMEAAQDRLAELLRSPDSGQAQSVPERRPWRTAYTDASWGGGRIAGMSFVDSTGKKWKATTERGVWSPLAAEVSAIHLAWREMGGRLRVRTDSQPAVHAICGRNKGIPNSVRGRTASQLVALRLAFQRGDLKVQWVRGHNGNVWNEAADRMAVAARRGAAWRVPPDVTDRTLQRVMEDLREALAQQGQSPAA